MMVLSRSALIPVLCLGLAIPSLAQTEMAALHRGLLWQRTSPTRQQPDGPVLYQIIFRTSATPGNIPVVSATHTSGGWAMPRTGPMDKNRLRCSASERDFGIGRGTGGFGKRTRPHRFEV